MNFAVCFGILLRFLILTPILRLFNSIKTFNECTAICVLNNSSILLISSSDGDDEDSDSDNDGGNLGRPEANPSHNAPLEILNERERVERALQGDEKAIEEVKEKYPTFFDKDSGNYRNTERGLREVAEMLEEEFQGTLNEPEEKKEDDIDRHNIRAQNPHLTEKEVQERLSEIKRNRNVEEETNFYDSNSEDEDIFGDDNSDDNNDDDTNIPEANKRKREDNEDSVENSNKRSRTDEYQNDDNNEGNNNQTSHNNENQNNIKERGIKRKRNEYEDENESKEYSVKKRKKEDDNNDDDDDGNNGGDSSIGGSNLPGNESGGNPSNNPRVIHNDLDIPEISIGSILDDIGNILFFTGFNTNLLLNYPTSFKLIKRNSFYYKLIFNIYLKILNIIILIKKDEDKPSIKNPSESHPSPTPSESHPLPSPTPSESISVREEHKYKKELNKEDEMVNQPQSVNDSEMERRWNSWINNTKPEGNTLSKLKERWEEWKYSHLPERGVGTLGKIIDTVKTWFDN